MTNYRLSLGCFMLAAALAARSAQAQATRPAAAPSGAVPAGAAVPPQRSTPIAEAIKSGNAPAAATLDAFIVPEVANLANPDPKVQAAARQKLEDGAVSLAAGVTASPAYQAAYAQRLNAAVVAFFNAKPPKDVRARLSAGIVVGRVAGRVENAALADATVRLLNDPAAPVVVWGAKAARSVAPRQYAAGGTSVGAAVVTAMQKFPQLDVVTEDGYEAIAGDATPAANRGAAVPHVLAVLQARLAQYQKAQPGGAPEPPGSPASDSSPGLLFIYRAWGAMTKPQQQTMVRVMLDLAKEAARLAAGQPAGGKDDLIAIVKQSGSVTNTLLSDPAFANNAALAAAATAVSRITVNTPPALVTTQLDALEGAFRATGFLGGATATPGGAAPAGAGSTALGNGSR